MAGFIFGAGTPYTSHADLQKQRAIADALQQQAAYGADSQSLPEGVANLGVGILSALMKGRAAKTERAGKADFDSRFNSVTDSLLSGGKDKSYAPKVSGDVASGIKATAEALGIDPVDLGTAISYETAGTFDPTKGGPTTKWGKHRGLIQFGEPQAAKYGVDWNDPVGSQLGPEGAVAKYLVDAGVKPGMGLLDIYSAINAGKVGRYGASDAAAGGAWGTVADKVKYQMAGHQDKAKALLGGVNAMAAPAARVGGTGGEVIMPASAPPSMMQQAPAPSAGAQTRYQRDGLAMDNRGMSQAGGGFFSSYLPPDASPEQTATVQQAETSLGQMPIEQIAELASNPYAEDWQKNLMQQYLEHRMEQQFADPVERQMKLLQMKKLQQELQPGAKARPATPEEKKAFGLPENAPVFIKPDGTPEILDTSKLGGASGYRPATPEEKQSFGVSPEAPLMMSPDGKPSILSDGKTTVNVGGGSDKQIFDETKARADAARAANTGLSALNQAQKALPGAITGAAANERLALQKVAQLFGVGDTQAIADTETFRSAIAPQVAAMLKATVGSTQISNADREFAEKAAGGAITLDAQSIQRLLNIMRAANSEIVRGFNADLDKVYPAGQGFDRERALFAEPNADKFYGTPIGPQVPVGQSLQQRDASGPGQPNVRKYNPKTGKIE